MNTADDLRGAITYELSDALAKVMNAQAPDCPSLYWSFRYGEVWSRAGLSGLAGVDYPDYQTGTVALSPASVMGPAVCHDLGTTGSGQ